ncbi:fasciclin domain-containing protein [Altibacter sp.]|uniref:fasciclin domain-containing protein n=1 Tax=Altibacter sp. TaxID=2024823 RepID=UPI0025903E21|nr:fasciclin domain-containing protein [Altibacter sp.]MCW9037553.1 fasciclin domain-containing protein [Altibacter sp.]
MKKSNISTLIALTVTLLVGSTSIAQDKMMKDAMNNEKTVMVGGAAMYPSKNIIENAVNSKDHTTLVAAVKAGELVDVLQGEGPFTVFAPTNAAFAKLPDGTVEALVKPENKAKLQSILTYHVLSGNYSAEAIVNSIKKGKGKATFKTVNGGTLTAMLKGNNVVLKDENGGISMVTITDVFQSNGVIHVVDTVVLPGTGSKK